MKSKFSIAALLVQMVVRGLAIAAIYFGGKNVLAATTAGLGMESYIGWLLLTIVGFVVLCVAINSSDGIA